MEDSAEALVRRLSKWSPELSEDKAAWQLADLIKKCREWVAANPPSPPTTGT